MQKLKDWFYSLQPRERMFIGGGGLLLAIAAIFVLGLGPFYSAVKASGQRVAAKEGDLAWMRSVAGEVKALGANAAANPAPSGESLVVLIDRTARECGLGQALSGQTPAGDNSIRVRLDNAEFDKLMVCLSNLQQVHALSIEQASIDRTGTPGFVNVGLTLTRAGG
jgi:general secretion pathway protein M